MAHHHRVSEVATGRHLGDGDDEAGSPARHVLHRRLDVRDAKGEVVWGPRYERYPEGGAVYGGMLSEVRLSDLGNGRFLFGYGRTRKEDPDDPTGKNKTRPTLTNAASVDFARRDDREPPPGRLAIGGVS